MGWQLSTTRGEYSAPPPEPPLQYLDTNENEESSEEIISGSENEAERNENMPDPDPNRAKFIDESNEHNFMREAPSPLLHGLADVALQGVFATQDIPKDSIFKAPAKIVNKRAARIDQIYQVEHKSDSDKIGIITSGLIRKVTKNVSDIVKIRRFINGESLERGITAFYIVDDLIIFEC